MNVQLWFATPFYIKTFSGEQLTAIQNEIDLGLKDYDHLSLGNPWNDSLNTSFTYNNFKHQIDDFNLSTLKGAIFEAVTELNGMYKISSECYIQESWFNFYKKGDYQGLHIHPGSFLSGVYFYKTNGEDGDLHFQTPVPSGYFETCPIASQTVIVKPVVGKLIIFPSWLFHKVIQNNSSNERITLAFNVFRR